MKAMRIGECIYCRTKQGPFGDEHLIARGLNGPWVLNEASCKERCQKITSAFEGHVLGPVLRGARAGLKMRMGDRPTTLPLLIDRGDGDFVEVQVPIEDYPAVVQFPEYLPPAYLDTRPYTSGIDLCGERTIQVAGPRPEDVGRRLGAKVGTRTKLHLLVTADATIGCTCRTNALQLPRCRWAARPTRR